MSEELEGRERRYFISFKNPHRDLGKGLTSFDLSEKKRKEYHEKRKQKLEYVERISSRKRKELKDKYGDRIKIRRVFKETASISCVLEEELIEEIKKDPEIENVWLVGEATIAAQVVPYGVSKVGATQVHVQGIKGTGVKVAVLDTGIDTDHEDLAANYAGGCNFVATATDHRERSNNIATIGTYYSHYLQVGTVVTVSGLGGVGYNGTWTVASVPTKWHFTYTNTGTNEAQTADTNGLVEKTTPEDDNGHGTHVAGTIAAVDNTVGVIGVAPEAKIYAVKVLDGGGNGHWDDIDAGIEWCITNGMKIINISLSGLSNPDLYGYTIEETINSAYNAGILLVAAAGNQGNSDYRGYSYNASNGVYVNEVADMSNPTPNDVLLPPMQISVLGDAFYIGSPWGKFARVTINVGTAKSVTGGTYQWQYWNLAENAWLSLASHHLVDNTNFFGIAGINDITFSPPDHWAALSIDDPLYYPIIWGCFYIRAIVTGLPSAIATAPLGTQIWVDSVGWPAKYTNAIAVSMTTSNDQLYYRSSQGDSVELAAPGVGVLSCKMGGGYVGNADLGYPPNWNGTSMACPHVAGVAALYWGKYKADNGVDPSSAQVRQWLIDNAKDLGDPGRDRIFGYGRVYYPTTYHGQVITVIGGI